MHRFSRNKFFSKVSFEEFILVAQQIFEQLKETKPYASLEFITCEDSTTYSYSKVTFWHDEVTNALRQRKHYSLEEFTQEIWNQSLDVQLTFKDERDPEPFMICVSVDRNSMPKSMWFYGQDLTEEAHKILSGFAQWQLFSFVGSGYQKSSDFNMQFGQRITGMRL